MTRASVLEPEVHAGDHLMGAADAPVTLVEYGDYQCPHCAKAHPIVRRLQQHFGAQLRFVFRNFPLSEIHSDARRAAEAAESVATHAGGAVFWEMHHSIFAHQRDGEFAFDEPHLVSYAAALGVSADLVRTDIQRSAHESRIRQDFLNGVRSGVNGTPTFFINGRRFEGDWRDEGEFAHAIAQAATERTALS